MDLLARALWRPMARANRAVTRGWPAPLGRDLVFRVLNRVSARPGVHVDAVTEWGGCFDCDLRDFVQARVFYFRTWEPNLTRFVQHRLHDGDVFVDVGANIGYFSVLASRLVGERGRVVAIEASPSVYAILADNLARNAAANVRALNVAVSDHRDTLPLYAAPECNRGMGSLRATCGARCEALVPCAPLRDLLAPEELQRVRLLKIDVEGAEPAILLDLLANNVAYAPDMEIVVEIAPDAMRDAGTSADDVIHRFEAIGYHWYVLDNSYSVHAYFERRARPPVRGTTVPGDVMDVVFSRTAADTLALA